MKQNLVPFRFSNCSSLRQFAQYLLRLVVFVLIPLSKSWAEGEPSGKTVEQLQPIDITLFQDCISHWQKRYGRDRKDPRYEPSQVIEIAENLLRYQNADGGWPKDI